MTSPLTRRSALRTLTGAASLAVLGGPAATAQAAMKGNLRHSVCRWCFKDIELDALCASARSLGLASVELLHPSEFAVAKKHGLVCAIAFGPTADVGGVSVGGIPKAWNRLEYHDALVAAYETRIEAVADAGFDQVICFSGNRDGMDDETGLANCAAGLERIMGFAERHRVTVTMELLNSRVNHKDYMCDRTAWGVELAKRVGSERFKLLYDIYHMQIMEGDVIRTIRDNHAFIGHYHTAGNPGRNEFTRPEDTQELNYLAIMQAIRDTGYRGFIGQEFIPKRDPLVSLREAVALCDV